MLTHELSPLTQAIEAIAEHGYAIIEDFLTPSEILSLASIAKEKWINGEMVSAKTGRAGLKNQNIRGDYITWLEAQDTQPAVLAYQSQMEFLRMLLNSQLQMNLQELETHIALYPVGSFYQKHLDQFTHGSTPNLQHRQLSAVLYLNQDWELHHGGALRLHLTHDKFIDILPQAGRMVFFLSAKFWHEVLPTQRERLSLTGWFRTRHHLII
jgi:SM-20-related protein